MLLKKLSGHHRSGLANAGGVRLYAGHIRRRGGLRELAICDGRALAPPCPLQYVRFFSRRLRRLAPGAAAILVDEFDTRGSAT